MYAMAKYLERIGYDVTVFDCQRTLKHRLLRQFSYNPRRQIRKLGLQRLFGEDRSAIRVLPYRGQNLDLAILGSDEIWNLENQSFEHAPEYVGLGINASSIVAYAPSIGFAKPDGLVMDQTFRRGLSKLDGILARDEGTKIVAERITGRTISQVIDPTILVGPWEDFFQGGPRFDEDYILYYGYRSNPAFKSALVEFATHRNLRIYTAGYNSHEWCEKNLLLGPADFLRLMRDAKYVFTDTFHGFVMAVLLDKALCYAAPMKKIADIAGKLGMERDALSETSSITQIEVALDRSRGERNERIAELRECSRLELARLIDPYSMKESHSVK